MRLHLGATPKGDAGCPWGQTSCSCSAQQAQHQAGHRVLLAAKRVPRGVLSERRHHRDNVANRLYRLDGVVQAPGSAGLQRNVVAEQRKRRRLALAGDADDGGEGEVFLLIAARVRPQRRHGRRDAVGQGSAVAHESLVDKWQVLWVTNSIRQKGSQPRNNGRNLVPGIRACLCKITFT
mgnify:CR=1 FL=1